MRNGQRCYAGQIAECFAGVIASRREIAPRCGGQPILRGLAMIKTLKKMVVVLLMLTMSLIGMPTVVLAAPIGTDTLVQLDQRGELVSHIQAQLARDDVRAQFLARGVSPAEVDARIAALSTEELQMLSLHLDDLPAGGSVLAVIGVVFVVLLILELVGVTNVFTKI